MTTTRLFLARHGEIRGAGELFYGHLDVPLSERGLGQARALARRLAGVDLTAVYASDLQRTVEFGRIIAAPHGHSVERLPALREMSLGVLEGLTIGEAQQRYPQLAGKPYSAMIDFRMEGGGESLRDVAARALPVLSGLVERHRGEAILVASHNSVNRLVLAQALGLPDEGMFRFGQRYGCLNLIQHDGRGTRVMFLNERPDLDGGLSDGIRVNGIRFEGRHGWHAEERERTRMFRVDVLARTPLGRSGISDELEDTVDYRDMAEVVVELGTGRSFRLLEALGRAIAGALLERFGVLDGVEVTVYKPAPGLRGEPDETAAQISLAREDV